MAVPRVYFTSGDDINWGIDEDRRLTEIALRDVAEITDLNTADIVHGFWWMKLMQLADADIAGKRVVCFMANQPAFYLQQTDGIFARKRITRWIARSTRARQEFESAGIPAAHIPYLVDTDCFKPLPAEAPELEVLREQWGIPRDRYLIGSFQRDTEGGDLVSPKLVKGPDIFLETVRLLHCQGHPIHVVLAGPRRFWLMRQMEQQGIPFTYVGQRTTGQRDDNDVNILPRHVLNQLYNLLDVYVISSRLEGGPHSALEASAAHCKVIGRRVGITEDILEPAGLYDSPDEAAEILARDIQTDNLAARLEPQYQRILQAHTPRAAAPLFRQLYHEVMALPPVSPLKKPRRISVPKIIRRLTGSSDFTVGLWHEFHKPPYGGGNQFMLALKAGLQQPNLHFRENEFSLFVDSYLLNSIHFDVDTFRRISRFRRLNVVHRIDGPIFLIRGFDKEKDDLTYELNARYAAFTVLQSHWTHRKIVEMGYTPVNPVVIHNAVNPAIFHPNGRIPFDAGRKIRLISTSWSGNPRKGGAVYKWIEQHLDWNRFEYTFVGNASEPFERVRHIPPVSSEELANLLRQHDIYITASQSDPCSNALIEALSCGLPALYLNDGGHPELVQQGGLSFEKEDDILPQLERLAKHYEMYQRLITAPRMDEVAQKYLTLLKEAAW